MALSPIAFIGVGGTGGKTLRVIHKALTDTLIGAGWRGDLPAGWQFLHVDVPAVEDGIDPEIPLTLPHRDYLGITESQQIYESVDGQVSETGREGIENYLAFNSWRPWKPSRVEVAISGGAGQFRAVGRVALLSALSEKLSPRIRQTIDTARNNRQSLVEAQRALGQSTSGAELPLRIMVISSLGGGSGSGGLLDVCDVARVARSGESEEITAVVYLPEVFERNGGYDSGIAPNTFMGINELLNADWVQDTGHMPTSRAVHFERAGLIPDSKGSGPDNVFLVGNRNGKVTLGGATEIYKVFGQALSEFALSEAQQDQMKAYALTNRERRATSDGMRHSVPFKTPNTPTFTNLYALGFARLTIGRELFKEYSVQRLARECIVRLRDSHRLGIEPGDQRTDEQIVSDKARERWGVTEDGAVLPGRFLDRSGLSEVGAYENDVTRMLLPDTDFDQRFASWADATMRGITSKFGSGTIDAAEVRAYIAEAINNAVESEGGDRRGALAEDLYERARAWRWNEASGKATGIHHSLAQVVLDELAHSGIQVTLRLLGMLRNEVERALTDLEEERLSYLADFRALHNEIRQVGAGSKKIDLRVVDQEIIRGQAHEALSLSFYADSAKVAHELFAEISAGLVTPLELALEDARDMLALDIRGTEEKPSPLDIWPKSGGSVPDHLHPSKVEFTLDEVSEFPKAFDDVIMKSAEGKGPNDSFANAVSDIIRGDNLPPQIKTRAPYFYRSPWAPRYPDRLRGPREQGGRAIVELRLGLEDILERSRAWVDDREKEIGRYANLQLRNYLTEGNGSQQRTRKDRLVDQFTMMLDRAMPLVQIDSRRHQMAHGRSVPLIDLVLAPLNVPDDDTELIGRLNDAAAFLKNEKTSISLSLSGSGTSVISTLRQPVHPVAVDSLMAPILGQWDSARNDPDFWKFTRARPIQEWVPLSPDAQLALARGWLTSRLLGRARFTRVAADRQTIEVLLGEPPKGLWTAISNVGVRRVTPDDGLGNLYEMYTIAQLEVYRTASTDPLIPFNALMEVGVRHKSDHPLRHWIETGVGVVDSETAVLSQAIDRLNLAADSPGQRADVALKALDQMATLEREDADLVDGPTDIGSLQDRAGLEAIPLALAAIDDLRILAIPFSHTADDSGEKHAKWGR